MPIRLNRYADYSIQLIVVFQIGVIRYQEGNHKQYDCRCIHKDGVRMFMIDDDKPNDRRYPNIDKIAKRKVIVMGKVLDDQADKFEIKKINDDAFSQIKITDLFILDQQDIKDEYCFFQ